MQANPVLRDIVLLGGGHAHVIVVKKWGMKPLPGVRLTLISRDVLTPYSGMLPGLLSGHYTIEDTHIDLARLCRWANVRFIEADISGLDNQTKTVQLENRPSIGFDVLSLDTGSTPNLDDVDGARQFTVPVKPVHRFHERWQQLLGRVRQQHKPLRIGVVGAGAGGFELLQAMHYRLQTETPDIEHEFHWIVRGETVLDGHNGKVQQLATAECRQKKIVIHKNFSVQQVRKNCLHAGDERQLPLNEIIWVTDARGPQWLRASGLELDDKGFLAVNDFLQSVSCDYIFGAGDVATQIDDPRPKAGVFAVRAGPILFNNLQRYSRRLALKKFKPQKNFLSILATGEKSAIASKGRFSAHGRWVWRWKDRIDVGFMDKFNRLPAKKIMAAQAIAPVLLREEDEDFSDKKIRCAGCGGKIAGDILSQVLAGLEIHRRADQLSGLEAPDDAAIIDPAGQRLAQSVDQLRSMLDDPYVFAQIAANHALSDLYAMGAEPQSAMALITLPYAADRIQRRELAQLMHGCVDTLNQAGCTLSGGHTSEGAELSLGFVVNGLLTTAGALHKDGLRDGDLLILSKPLGSGVLLAADMQARAKGTDIQACIKQMQQSNRVAADIFKQYKTSAMTDITGFGLLGHLLEMLSASDVSCELEVEKIPLMSGALELSRQGIRSTLFPKNLRFAETFIDARHWRKVSAHELLFDPQTSGGLLAGISETDSPDCLAALQQAGYSAATVIGKVTTCKKPASRINIA